MGGWYESGKRKAKALPTETLAEHYRHIKYTQLNSDVFTGTVTVDYLLENPADFRASLRGLTKHVYQTNVWTNASAVTVFKDVEANSTFVDDLLYGAQPASEMQPIPSVGRVPCVDNSLDDLQYSNNVGYFESLGFRGPSASLWYPSYGFWYFSNGLWDPSGLWVHSIH